MSKRSIDESLRKPRVISGTPLNRTINLISLGIFACSGICWYLYEMWPQSKKVHKSLLEGKFDDSPESKFRLQSMRYLLSDPQYHELVVKMQKRTYDKERASKNKEKPWYVKAFTQLSKDEV
ncbi:uncharacterized protein LOC123676402 [Harmonia axyridis]|uniref:uncharacterized protein LOC123676402 n=1 Tax=Harmonia axyridis TaxID=115357 RepID=UPI001E275DA1|nr:uncharacterized protein LOC123676402 [Harmonia axyridis]